MFAVAFLISAVEGKAGRSQFYCDYQILCSGSESLSRAGPVHTHPDCYCSEPRLFAVNAHLLTECFALISEFR